MYDRDRAAIPEAGLDRELLARVMHAQHPDQQSWSDWQCRKYDRQDAAAIATEYERLRAEPAEKGAPE